MPRPRTLVLRRLVDHPPPTPQETPCRLWQGPLIAGYGNKFIPGRGSVLMHRWVWEQINGPIPDGMWVLHRCDNRLCYRYDHLFLGTNADNARDMWNKGRGRSPGTDKTHCPNGHPYDEANTYHWTMRTGYISRHCRICTRAAGARYYRRKNQK